MHRPFPSSIHKLALTSKMGKLSHFLIKALLSSGTSTLPKFIHSDKCADKPEVSLESLYFYDELYILVKACFGFLPFHPFSLHSSSV